MGIGSSFSIQKMNSDEPAKVIDGSAFGEQIFRMAGFPSKGRSAAVWSAGGFWERILRDALHFDGCEMDPLSAGQPSGRRRAFIR